MAKNTVRAATSRRTQGRAARRTVRILFTCVGRRIELMDAFRRAAKPLGIRLQLHGADLNNLAPAMHRVDKSHFVPRIGAPGHIEALTRIVEVEGIDLVIPLIDSDLVALAEAVPQFERAGARVVISSPAVVRICRDKLLTYQTLSAAGIDTPETRTWEEARALSFHSFPYYMKPRHGSAGLGNFRIHSVEELEVLGRRVPEAIVQEFVEGTEHTLDVYVDAKGKPRCVVPRRRLEVRTGEVSKAVIVKDRAVMVMGRRVAEALGECRGVVTIQCMVTPEKRIRVIEINPRFGGGAPLSIHAGADFPKWLLAEFLGIPIRISPLGYRDKVVMLRYDESVFLNDGAASRRIKPSMLNL